MAEMPDAAAPWPSHARRRAQSKVRIGSLILNLFINLRIVLIYIKVIGN